MPAPLPGRMPLVDVVVTIWQPCLLAIMRESIDYGLKHRADAVRHSMPYARDMDSDLAGKFIGMYVNDYTRDYGETGREAIRRFLNEAAQAGYIPKTPTIEFVE